MSLFFAEGRHPAEFILSEANGNRSRDNGVIVDAVDIAAGQVLGLVEANEGVVTVGAATFAGTGNGVLTKANPANSAAVIEGSYKIQLIDEGANAGDFEVVRPDGTVDGFASVGVAYDGQVKFTIADGATDFASPAAFTLPVTIADPVGVGKFGPFAVAGTDGTEEAAAIAIYPVPAAETNRGISLITRDCTVNGKCLTWPNGITDDQKATAINSLKLQGIIVR